MNNPIENTVENLIKTVYLVTCRRTSIRYAEEILTETIDFLQENQSLFKKLEISNDSLHTDVLKIKLAGDSSSIDSFGVSKSLESFIRLVYDEN